MNGYSLKRFSILIFTMLLPIVGFAQPPFAHFKSQPYKMSSGAFAPVEESAGPVFKQTINTPGAKWLRLQFGKYNLGNNSHIIITSLADGGKQRHDGRSLPNYRNRSAFFNGDSVTIELYVARGDKNVFYDIEKVYFEDAGATVAPEEVLVAPEELCGLDNRTATTDAAVGRFVFFDGINNRFAKCTAWIGSNGSHLTAAHCFNRSDYGDPDLMEFNVPLSSAAGSPNFADPDDQYPVALGSETIGVADNIGQDWAVFNTNPNSTTGLIPVQGQNDFFRMSKDSTPATIRITGYGVDDGSANRTLQTDTGPYITEGGSGSDVWIEYQVDTMSGNSGGPVAISGTETSIGIHTHAGCDPGTGDGNQGTSFENDALEAAIQGFQGTNVIYTDALHPIAPALESGTVLRPYDTIPEATTVVPSGGRVSIVAGSYTSSAGNTFLLGEDGKSMMLDAPVGTVTIGN